MAERLLLHPRKAHVSPTADGLDLLGYLVFPTMGSLETTTGTVSAAGSEASLVPMRGGWSPGKTSIPRCRAGSAMPCTPIPSVCAPASFPVPVFAWERGNRRPAWGAGWVRSDRRSGGPSQRDERPGCIPGWTAPTWMYPIAYPGDVPAPDPLGLPRQVQRRQPERLHRFPSRPGPLTLWPLYSYPLSLTGAGDSQPRREKDGCLPLRFSA